MAGQGKIAVITGAGSGIGRASAHALLEDGWTVVLAGRRRNMLEETATLRNAPPPRTLVVPTDVSDAASIAALYEVAEETGHLPAESESRVPSLRSLDLVGAQSGGGELAAAIQGALPAVDELTRDLEANYKLELI